MYHNSHGNFALSTRFAVVLALAASMMLVAFLPVPGVVHVQATQYSMVGVVTENSSGAALQGYYVTLWQNGVVINSCFSTCGFTVQNGVTYQVAVSDYGTECFNHWSGTGDTNRFLTFDFNFSSSTSVLFNAVYTTCGTSGLGTSELLVNSQTTTGKTINGYYTVLSDSSGNVVSTGFTAVTFNVNNGQTYNLHVDNYGNCNFAYWYDTGSTSSTRQISIYGTTYITAIYNCGGGGGSSGTSTISVSTVNSAGSPITGYYIALFQGGSQIKSCFSQCSFTVNNGQTYKVVADSYGSETFNHWQNDGSTGAETVNVPSTTSTIPLTAVYSP